MNAAPLPRSPYKGLMPYDEADAPFFFGREPDIEIISANLQAARLTVLYGASGVGKSSVLRAGVAHTLRQQALEHPTEGSLPEFGVVVYSSWRDDPIAGLLRRVADSVAGAPRSAAGELLPGTRSLVQGLRPWTARLGGDLLIILDQFEEYFLYHPFEDGDGTFAVEFPRAVNRADLRVHFLIAIREDALAKLDRFKGRIPNLFDNYLRIEHLDRAAARAAIEQPIAQYNRLQPQVLSIDRDLVDQVLEQVKTGQVVLGETGRGRVLSGGPAAAPAVDDRIEMPYLQLVMTRLWDEEQLAGSAVLRLATLTRLGGAENIVRTHLDATLRALSAAEQDDAARVFNFLVTPSGAKIAHTVQDLALYGRIAEDRLAAVLVKLAAPEVRILRPVAAPPDQPQAPRYEIFHDVLAPAILDWRARFLQAQARAEAEQRLQAERGAAEQRLAAERQRSRRLWLGVVGLSFLLVAMITLAVIARQQTVRANQARAAASAAQAQAVSRELAAAADLQLDVDPELSILLAVEAVKAADTAQAQDALRRSLVESRVQQVLRGHTAVLNSIALSRDEARLVSASADGTARVWPLTPAAGTEAIVLRGHTGAVNGAAFSPDGRWVATAGADKTVRLWPLTDTGRQPLVLTGHTDGVYSAFFSPDGIWVLTASLDGTARVWQAADGAAVAVLRGHTGEVRSALFSPDGRRVVTAGADGTARIWDPASGKQLSLLAGHADGLRSAVFSPDGRWVLTAGADKSARLWNAETGEEAADLIGHTDWVLRAAFSPDGAYAATASGDGTARVWRLTFPESASEAPAADLVAELRGHTDWAMSVAFSRDSRYVVTAGQDGTARVWETATGRSVAILRGHTGPIRAAGFTANGLRVITASEDGTARVWDAGITGPDVVLAGHTNAVWNAGFSSDGRYVATAGGDETARIWSAETGQSLAELRGHTGWVYQAIFSPDGRLLTTGADRTARLWQSAGEAGGGAAGWRQTAELRGHTGDVTGAAFSPDGKVAATASEDRTTRLWNMPAAGAAGDSAVISASVELAGHSGAVLAVAFSPDGQRLVTASSDGAARVWRLAFGDSGQVRAASPERELRHNGDVYTAVFSPDGTRILTASRDNLAVVWDAATGRPIFELGHARDVYSAAFSPDGTRIVTASADNTARVWQASDGGLVAELRGHTNGVLGATFSVDGRWIATASMDGAARIWDARNGLGLAVLRGSSQWVYSATFGPRDNRVLTAGEDGLARLYRCALCAPGGALLALVPARTTRPLTGDECRAYLHRTDGCPTPAP